MKRLKRIIAVTSDFFDGIFTRKIWTFAAAAAFYLFLSLIPILGLVCSLLPYTPLTEEIFLSYLADFAPQELYSILAGIITSIYDSSTATLSVTAVALVWSASLSMVALMRGMDAAQDLKRKENFIVFRLRGCFFMVIGLAAVLMTLCGIVYGGKILNLLSAQLDGSWAEVALFAIVRVGRYPVMMLFLFAVFLLLYTWMPAGRRKLLRQWPGALFATVAWLVFSWAFALYVNYSDRYGVYGILGTVIVSLLWIYYCLFILLVGAYINRFVREEPDRLRAAHPNLAPPKPTPPKAPEPEEEIEIVEPESDPVIEQEDDPSEKHE